MHLDTAFEATPDCIRTSFMNLVDFIEKLPAIVLSKVALKSLALSATSLGHVWKRLRWPISCGVMHDPTADLRHRMLDLAGVSALRCCGPKWHRLF